LTDLPHLIPWIAGSITNGKYNLNSHFQCIRTPGWPAKKDAIFFTEVRSRYPGYKRKATEVLLANLGFNIIRQNR